MSLIVGEAIYGGRWRDGKMEKKVFTLRKLAI